MPSSAQHAKRIQDGLQFIATEQAVKHPNELATAFFYAVLHMFEATLFDFTAKPKPQHCYTHGDRTKYLGAVRYDTKHWFFSSARDYEALRGISEQARYLSPAGSHTYEPLQVPRDLDQARALFDDIRRQLESEYEKRQKKAPWL